MNTGTRTYKYLLNHPNEILFANVLLQGMMIRNRSDENVCLAEEHNKERKSKSCDVYSIQLDNERMF